MIVSVLGIITMIVVATVVVTATIGNYNSLHRSAKYGELEGLEYQLSYQLSLATTDSGRCFDKWFERIVNDALREGRPPFPPTAPMPHLFRPRHEYAFDSTRHAGFVLVLADLENPDKDTPWLICEWPYSLIDWQSDCTMSMDEFKQEIAKRSGDNLGILFRGSNGIRGHILHGDIIIPKPNSVGAVIDTLWLAGLARR